jgi:hypothetical protein
VSTPGRGGAQKQLNSYIPRIMPAITHLAAVAAVRGAAAVLVLMQLLTNHTLSKALDAKLAPIAVAAAVTPTASTLR